MTLSLTNEVATHFFAKGHLLSLANFDTGLSKALDH
jgi:hypothetical protein